MHDQTSVVDSACPSKNIQNFKFEIMVQSCSAQYCKERSRPGSGVSFHSFPQDDKIKDQWVLAACKYNFKPQKYSRLCSKHFSPDDYVTNGWSSKKVLRKDAVPKIIKKLLIHEENKCDVIVEEYPPVIKDNINIPPQKQDLNETRNVEIIVAPDLHNSIINKSNKILGKGENDVNNQIDSEKDDLESPLLCSPFEKDGKFWFPVQAKITETDDSEDLGAEVTISVIQKKKASLATTTEINNCKQNQSSIKKEKKNLKSENGKELARLKELSKIFQGCTNSLKNRLMEKRKQVKALQQRNRRLIRRINKLNTLIGKQPKPLKNEIKVDSEAVTNLLKPLTPTSRVIIKEMMKTKRSKVYPAELKNFALTLNFYSPKSYLYVKRIFPTMLPHPRTLLKWS